MARIYGEYWLKWVPSFCFTATITGDRSYGSRARATKKFRPLEYRRLRPMPNMPPKVRPFKQYFGWGAGRVTGSARQFRISGAQTVRYAKAHALGSIESRTDQPGDNMAASTNGAPTPARNPSANTASVRQRRRQR